MEGKSKDPSIGPGSSGSWFVTKLLEKCEKMGIQILAETTYGGIVINENGEVLKSKDGKDVVPGLFGAGDASGGWTIDKPMPAISAGNWTVSSGYMAGVAAAKYLGKA